MAKFKTEVLDKIKSDPDLFALVAKASNCSPGSLHAMISRNGKMLNQYSVVTAVAEYLKTQPGELVAECKATAA